MNLIDPLADAIAQAVLARLEPVLKAREGIRPRLLTAEQAAQYLGRTVKGIRHQHAGGQLPAVRTDSRVFFDIQDLDRWIVENKR